MKSISVCMLLCTILYRNLGGRSIAESEGNLYNTAQKISLTKDDQKIFTLVANKKTEGKLFKETAFAKELRVPSKQSGQRWSNKGAQNMLNLRVLAMNG